MSTPANPLTTSTTNRFSFIRGLSVSDYLTMANGLGGVAAVLSALGYMADPRPARLLGAMAFFPFCLLMDFLDGRVARARHRASALGQELDSLADAVSFGVAPAAIAFAAGLRGAADVAALLFFVGCAIGRLARYNTTAAAAADSTGDASDNRVRWFEGVPVTGSGLMVAALAVSAATRHLGAALPAGALAAGPIVLHPLALGFVAVGCAMISKRLHVPKP